MAKVNQVFLVFPMPPSINTCYGTNWATKRRYRTEAYREWLKDCESALLLRGKRYKFDPDEKLSMSYSFYSKWINKNGSIKTKDLSNYFKALEDMMNEFLEGFDDSRIFRYEKIEKIHSDREEVEIKISEITTL